MFLPKKVTFEYRDDGGLYVDPEKIKQGLVDCNYEEISIPIQIEKINPALTPRSSPAYSYGFISLGLKKVDSATETCDAIYAAINGDFDDRCLKNKDTKGLLAQAVSDATYSSYSKDMMGIWQAILMRDLLTAFGNNSESLSPTAIDVMDTEMMDAFVEFNECSMEDRTHEEFSGMHIRNLNKMLHSFDKKESEAKVVMPRLIP